MRFETASPCSWSALAACAHNLLQEGTHCQARCLPSLSLHTPELVIPCWLCHASLLVHLLLTLRSLLCILPVNAEGAIDEAMAEVLDEDYPGGGMMNGGGGAFVV